MDDTIIDITPSSTKSVIARKGLKICRNEQESLVAGLLEGNTKSIPFDYQWIRESIRERAQYLQKEAQESGFSYDMTNASTVPLYIRTRYKWGVIYGPAFYTGTLLFIAYIISSVLLLQYGALFFFVFFLVMIVIPLVVWYFSILRPVLLSCRTFKEIAYTPSNKEIDHLFDIAVRDALHQFINNTARSLVSGSRIRTHSRISPLAVALDKPDTECILKIIPYPEDEHYECSKEEDD